MTRTHAPTALALLLGAATPLVAQQPAATVPPAARAVAPTGPGLQPQVGATPYLAPPARPAARGVNPFAAPGIPTQPGVRVAPRPGFAPGVVAPAPGAPPVLNNPGLFNPGFVPPFPVALRPAVLPPNGVAFNPVLVTRPPVVSAYYVPPLVVRQPGTFRYASPTERVNPASGTVHDPVAGTATLADGTTYYRVPGVGPTAADTYGTGLYYNAETGTYFNPSSGFVVRPGEFRYIPWVW